MNLKIFFFFGLLFYSVFNMSQNQNAIEVFNNRNDDLDYAVESLTQIKNNNNSNENQLLTNSLLALTYITKKEYEKTKEHINLAEKFSKKGQISEGEAFLLYATARLYLVLDDVRLRQFHPNLYR